MVYVNDTLSYHQRLAEDPRIEYFGKEHLIYALVSIFIILLLVLYPIKKVLVATLQFKYSHCCFFKSLCGEILQLL